MNSIWASSFQFSFADFSVCYKSLPSTLTLSTPAKRLIRLLALMLMSLPALQTKCDSTRTYSEFSPICLLPLGSRTTLLNNSQVKVNFQGKGTVIVPCRTGMLTLSGRHKEREASTKRNPQLRWEKWALTGSTQLQGILTTRGY